MYVLEHFGKNLYVIFLFNSNPDQGTLTIVHTWSPTDSAKYNIEIIMVVLNFLIRRDTNPAWNM